MKRREFCASAISTLGAATLPFGRVFSASSTGADVSAVTGDGRRILLRSPDLADFAASLRGQLLFAGSSGYDDARRIWNGMFDRKPALIARCAGAADVMKSVQFARAHQLLVAVRGGGHSLSGQSVCDDGLMIDLAPMRSVRVDTGNKRARVEPGVLLGDLDRESIPFGLATPTGTVSHTGAAGLTLGGGFGRLGRRFALTCDNVTSIDVATADGQLLQASATENADLFWAVRGGGGNFGVATSFEYRLHPFDNRALAGHVYYAFAEARNVLRAFADAYARAPDELWIEPVLVAAPTGEKLLYLDICDTGAGENIVAPYRRLGTPLKDEVGPVPFTRLQTKDDQRSRPGLRYYTKSGFLPGLSHDLIDLMVETIAASPVRGARLALAPTGGAIARIASDATAFWHRDAAYSLVFTVFSDDPATDATNVAWAKARWSSIEAFSTGFYANTSVADIPAERMRGAYGGNYERLAALKNKYDPKNLFRLNANIQPTAA